MSQPDLKVQAKLLDGTDYIPVEAEYLSKYSIFINFSNGKTFPDGFVFSRLILQLNGSAIKLGPCKLLKGNGYNEKQGKIVFVKDVYDFDNLFFKKNIVKLQSLFINVPLILGHKDEIRDDFKNYTSNLTYDLSVYKNLFDQIDSQIADEPEDVKKIIQKSIIETEGRKFMTFLDEKLLDLQKLVADYSSPEHERHGFYLRKQLWNMIITSPIMYRTNVKPRGYAGDFEMMKMIYDNNYEGDTIFGKVMHKHPIEHPGSQAVRTRRKLIAKSFLELEKSKNWKNAKQLRLLSVACGPAYELQDLLSGTENPSRIHFTLLDQDREALDAARSLAGKLENENKYKLNIEYLNESVRTMLTTNQIAQKWGKFNCIYSMGLFDYLTPPAARVVLRKLYELLLPGGEMIIGNFHVSNSSRIYMEYWMDWVLYYRTEEEFLNLLSGDASAQISVFFENTGSQMFLHVTKHT